MKCSATVHTAQVCPTLSIRFISTKVFSNTIRCMISTGTGKLSVQDWSAQVSTRVGTMVDGIPPNASSVWNTLFLTWTGNWGSFLPAGHFCIQRTFMCALCVFTYAAEQAMISAKWSTTIVAEDAAALQTISAASSSCKLWTICIWGNRFRSTVFLSSATSLRFEVASNAYWTSGLYSKAYNKSAASTVGGY